VGLLIVELTKVIKRIVMFEVDVITIDQADFKTSGLFLNEGSDSFSVLFPMWTPPCFAKNLVIIGCALKGQRLTGSKLKLSEL